MIDGDAPEDNVRTMKMGGFAYLRLEEPPRTSMGMGGALSVIAGASGLQGDAIYRDRGTRARAIRRALITTHPHPLPGPTPAWEQLMEALYLVVGLDTDEKGETR